MSIFRRKREQPDAPSQQGDAPPAATLPARRIRLLIADENPTALDVIGRRLSHAGHDVMLAEDGIAALGMLVAHKFDLIILDMGMTRLSGIATMRKMRASGLLGGASILLVTARSDAAAMVEALDAGADDQIVKPFDFTILDARIRHIVARAKQIADLALYNERLDARIARRAVELGEARAQLEEMTCDRARLISSIQALHDEIARLNARA